MGATTVVYDDDIFQNIAVEDLWYTVADYSELMDEVKHIAIMIENGKIKDDNIKYTIRGIEKHGCHSQCRLRHETIDRAIQSVIREQKSQKLKGVVDPCAISEAYFCNGAKKMR